METIAKELDVSVILPVYNERGHLKAEIDRVRTALSASSYSFEIIVIDGADKLDEINTYTQKLAQKYLNVWQTTSS